MNEPIYIASITRTPQGNLLGCFKDTPATQLGAVAIKAAMERAHLNPEQIEEVIMGLVLPASLGQAPARQAAIQAGIPVSVGATTINKMCGSGMKAVMLAHDLIKAGTNNIMVAGGMESMSNAPYLLSKARGGYRLGHAELKDHMFIDGLEDAYEPGKLMGVYAEATAKKYNFTREAQDEFAASSLTRAQQASKQGLFDMEIAPVITTNRKEKTTIYLDENPQIAKVEKIPNLRPAFSDDGTVTAANSSSISDGAAALVISSEEKIKELAIKPLAKIHAHATHSQESGWFTTAPVGAIKKLLDKTGWTIADVDLFEINEAFAVVTMAAMHDLGIAHEKVNIHGGGCALGHPIGASGARILVTLIAALKQNNLRKGIAALCIGGGEATAVAVEMI